MPAAGERRAYHRGVAPHRVDGVRICAHGQQLDDPGIAEMRALEQIEHGRLQGFGPGGTARPERVQHLQHSRRV